MDLAFLPPALLPLVFVVIALVDGLRRLAKGRLDGWPTVLVLAVIVSAALVFGLGLGETWIEGARRAVLLALGSVGAMTVARHAGMASAGAKDDGSTAAASKR